MRRHIERGFAMKIFLFAFMNTEKSLHLKMNLQDGWLAVRLIMKSDLNKSCAMEWHAQDYRENQ